MTEKPNEAMFSNALNDFHAHIVQRYTKPQETSVSDLLTEEKKIALKRKLAEITESMDEETRKFVGIVVKSILRCLFEDMEPMKSYFKIDKYLRILLTDSYFIHLPGPLDANRVALDAEKIFATGSLDELFDAWDAKMKQPKAESWLETVIPTLDIISAIPSDFPSNRQTWQSQVLAPHWFTNVYCTYIH